MKTNWYHADIYHDLEHISIILLKQLFVIFLIFLIWLSLVNQPLMQSLILWVWDGKMIYNIILRITSQLVLAASGLPEGEKVSFTFGLIRFSSFLGRSQNSFAEKIMGNELLMLPSSALETQLSPFRQSDTWKWRKETQFKCILNKLLLLWANILFNRSYSLGGTNWSYLHK